jgi:WD40 repeat protein
VWSAKKGECLHVLTASSALLTCSLSEPAGLLLCAGFHGAVHLWDARAFGAAPPVNCEGHGAEVRCAEFSSDGRYVLTAGGEGSVRVFDSRTGSALGALPLEYPVHSMAARVVEDSREDAAVCICGDEAGRVLIIRISGIRERLATPS